ncbi:MAG: hypothetical protein ACYDBW_05605 [Sulfuricaulis sp.]
MTGTSTTGAGKLLTRATLFGFFSLALYFLLYFFEDAILAFTSRGDGERNFDQARRSIN